MTPTLPCSRPRSLALLVAALLGGSVVPTTAASQRILTTGPDAVTLPRGTFRVETGGELTIQRDRWNEGRLEGIGGALTGTPLDATRLTLLAPIEGLVRGLGVDDFRASLGPTRLDVRQRLFASALGLEYGVTSRLTLGVRATLVRTRPEALSAPARTARPPSGSTRCASAVVSPPPTRPRSGASRPPRPNWGNGAPLVRRTPPPSLSAR